MIGPTFTPGPWMVVHELRDTDEAVADLVNRTWVIPARGTGLGSYLADANLIAAAPDLLNALIPFVARNSSEETITITVRTADITRARAAIAKAEGT